LFKFLRRNKKDNKETNLVATHALLMGGASRPVSETEMMEQLGINIHMIEDDKLNSFLEKISIIKDGDDKVEDIDLNTLALRIMSTKLIRASWVDPIDVDIAQLEVEALIDRIELDMDEDTYEFGGSNLLEAMGKVIQTAWSDAKGGRKAKLMKVTPRVYEISMTEPGKKKSGLIS